MRRRAEGHSIKGQVLMRLRGGQKKRTLGGDTPDKHGHRSNRKYKGSLTEIDYRTVSAWIMDMPVDLKWQGRDCISSEAL